MHKARLLLLSFLITVSAFSQKTTKAVFVIVDGIPADVMERLRPSTMFSIAKVGGYTRSYVGGERGGYSETPTISAVGYNSLLTGTWANKHNVWGNYGKQIDSINYNYWHLFRFFKNQYPQKKTAIFSTWEDNRTILLGSRTKGSSYFQPDFYYDGLELDTVRFPHDTAGYFYYEIDKSVAKKAAHCIKKNAPDLSWVYLEYTDEMGHRHGNGNIMHDAVLKMDTLIQPIWDAIQYRQKNHKEDWVIYITTDHGREDNGYHHGGQTERERSTWIITNAKNLNTRFTKQQSAIVDILPSIARHLKVQIPKARKFELDGVPLVGPISAVDAKAVLQSNFINVSWTAIDNKGMAKIWLATTNHFKVGGIDDYQLIKTVPVADMQAQIPLSNVSSFYKIAIEFPGNTLNRWVVKN